MRPSRHSPLFLCILSLALTLNSVTGWARSAPWDIEKLPATQAPAFSLPDLEGKTIFSAAFQGQLLLINFWATWCGPCRAEMPALDRLQQKFKAQGLTVIGIAIDSDKAVVQKFMSAAKTKFPILHDPEMTCHDAYKVFSYPTTFLIDQQGIIQKYWTDAQEWDSEKFEKTLQGYLHQPQSPKP